MKKRFIISAIILGLATSFSLTGCGDKKPVTETTSSETSQSTEESVSTETTSGDAADTSSTDTSSTDNSETTSNTTEESNDYYETVYYINTIENDGIYVVPYDEEDEMFEYGNMFYIKKENLNILKNGKTSLYDTLYFYDGCVLKFKGSIDEKFSYCEIVPTDGKVVINLIDDYKDLKQEDKTNKDESDVEVINKDKFKSDIIFNGTWCKFNYPPSYKESIIIKEEKDGNENRVLIGSMSEKDNRFVRIIILIREKSQKKDDITVGSIRGAKECIYISDGYIYWIEKPRIYEKPLQELFDKFLPIVEKNLMIIE